MALPLLFGGGLATETAAQAEIVYACVSNKYGMVRIVAEGVRCRDSETPLRWNVAGPQGPQGIPGPPGPQALGGSSPLAVFDAKGLKMGDVVTATYFVSTHPWIVGFTPEGAPNVVLAVMQTFSYGPFDKIISFAGAGFLYYASSDCSGQPFVDHTNAVLLTPFVAVGNGFAAIADTTQPQIITAKSAWTAGAGQGCSSRSSIPVNVFPVSDTIDLTAFTPPFTVAPR
jgi:hypothetical protein